MSQKKDSNIIVVLIMIGALIALLILALVKQEEVLLNGQNFYCEGRSHLSLLDEDQGIFYCEEGAVSVFFKYDSEIFSEYTPNTGIGVILDEDENIIQIYEINDLAILKTYFKK